jgi:hypothetical protein
MSLHPHQNLIRFEDSLAETKLVAIISQEIDDIDILKQTEFIESFDDLDFLIFAILPLPSKNQVSLVRHQNSPQPGIEICVKYNQTNVPEILQETLTKLNITINDLTWIHPEYESQIYILPLQK